MVTIWPNKINANNLINTNMDKIILTNGNVSINIDVTSGNSLSIFGQLLKSICNKKQIDTFKKPDGDWKRYEHRDANNELIQCSFWFN